MKEVFERAPNLSAVVITRPLTCLREQARITNWLAARAILGKPVAMALPKWLGKAVCLDSVFQTGIPFVGKEMKVLFQTALDAP